MRQTSAAKLWSWIIAKYWWLWGTNAILAVFVLGVFLLGLVNGWVGSHNLLPWLGILLLGAVVVGGSFWLRSSGHPGFAVFPLMFVLVCVLLVVGGSLLFSALYFLVFLLGNGRMN